MSDDSDDIQIIEKKTTERRNDDLCQLCPSKLHGLNEAERIEHYALHKSGEPISSRVSKRGRPKPASVVILRRKTTPMKLKRNTKDAAQDVFWHPALARAPPENYTPGVLSILKDALKHSHKKGTTQRAVLCHERTPHIYRESFDTAWGCGYRNFLMACAALMDQQKQTHYFPCLDDPLPPGVRNLQCWLEEAWKHDYDEIGANHFEHNLVDTNKKLGTGDLYVAFTSRRIPCMLVDFNIKNSPKGFNALTEWVVNYFTDKPEGDLNKILRAASPVVATDKMPIIMQYDGHSVTIVGYELAKNGKYNLLVFDPSSKVDQSIREAAINTSTSVDWTVSQSISLGKNKRRGQSKSPAPKKRSRTDQDPDDGTISIPDTDDEIENASRAAALKPTLDPDMVIKAFRPKIKKKDQYQLLYFTMGDLLTDEEQDNRRVVLSVAEC